MEINRIVMYGIRMNFKELLESFLYDGNTNSENVLYDLAKKEPERFFILIKEEKLNSEALANSVRILTESVNDIFAEKVFFEFCNHKYPIVRMGLLYGLMESNREDLIDKMNLDKDERVRNLVSRIISLRTVTDLKKQEREWK